MQKDSINYEEKVQRQLELEQEQVELGVKKYREQVKNTPEADLPPGHVLLKAAIEPLTKAINNFKQPSRGGGRLVDTRKFLLQIDTEEIAFITAYRLINAVSTKEPVQHAAITLAGMLKDHLEYKKFKKDKPNLLYTIEENLKSSTQVHKRRVIMRAKRLFGVEDDHWTETDRLHIGVKLIDLFITSTGLVERVSDPKGVIYLQGSAKTIEWLEKHHAKCELLNPVYMPMIIKPRQWVAPYGGGYLSNEATMVHKLIKTRNKKALEALEEYDMPLVYRAINAVQDTPWRINKKVYEVVKQCWLAGTGLAGLPPTDEEPLPPTPWESDEEFKRLKELQPEVVKAWKRSATDVYDQRVRTKSKRFAMIQKLWVAEKFMNEPEIFFPWTLDWRGRMYPIPYFIHPQADDSGKALLEFAKGKPLGAQGAYWLAIHLANKFGEDKVSFDERVQWTTDHEVEILDSAINPLDGMRFWLEADDPFQFLAACFEWQGYKEQGASFISHLPIALDGTCNGLQNFSAMLLDEVGGQAVNLVPSDKPQDIYQQVADIAIKKVEEDALNGVEEARLWLGKIDRGIAKRNVMTLPYGAKKYGFKDQLIEELKKRDEGNSEKYLDTEDYFPAAHYLANIMYNSIGDVVIAARKAMDWLQDAARIASQAEIPIRWTTPAGLLVHQEYIMQKLKQINTFWGGTRINLGLAQDTGKMNKTKQANGISPNFVHSMDASHLMLTINKCLDEGITDFALVHDSYATHACNTDKLAEILREAFIEQYSQDVLAKFRAELMSQLPPDLANNIPPLPPKGNLDLALIKESKYFFA